MSQTILSSKFVQHNNNGYFLPWEKRLSLVQVMMFFGVNIILAFLSKQNALFSTAYGLFVFFIGVYFLFKDYQPTRLIYLCGYIIGAELIWRSTDSFLFYEFGKYAIAFLLILAILKNQLFRHALIWPIVFFALLLPSIALLPSFDRQTISFFLSGPFLLSLSTLFFSSVKFKRTHAQRLLIAIIGPTIGIAFLALYSTLSATEIVFTNESNFTTSGGFGPVQISLQLGFGAVLAFYYAMIERKKRGFTILMGGIALWLIAQSVFTFARSGLYNSVGALIIGAFFFLQDKKFRGKLLVLGILSTLLFLSVVFPSLDTVTEGRLSTRFQDTSSSGRTTLIQADLRAFLENPILGVGPGQAFEYHNSFGIPTASHTEFSRLLAEHGILGLLALIILLKFTIERILADIPPNQKSFKLLLTTWSLLYMISVTMRTASVSFAFGLAASRFEFDD